MRAVSRTGVRRYSRFGNLRYKRAQSRRDSPDRSGETCATSGRRPRFSLLGLDVVDDGRSRLASSSFSRSKSFARFSSQLWACKSCRNLVIKLEEHFPLSLRINSFATAV